MTYTDAERNHGDLTLTGFRAHAAVTGLLQLIRELRRAEILSANAIDRIRDAVVDELCLDIPPHETPADYRQRVIDRLNKLLAEAS